MFSLLLFIPGYIGFRMGLERSGQDPDLMYITTLTPGRIVRGKAMVAGVLALLFVSTGVPFVLFSYLLQGVDLRMVWTLMILLTVSSLLFSYFAMVVGSVPGNTVAKVVLMLGLVLGYAGLSFWALGIGVMFIGQGFGFFSMTDWMEQWGLLLVVLHMGLAMCVFHAWILGIVGPPASNRCFPVRLTHTIVWIAMGLVLQLMDILSEIYGHSDSEGLAIWYLTSVGLVGLGLLMAICEREAPGPRVATQIPRNPLLRLIAFPFFTGQVNGVVWAVGIAVVSALVTAVTVIIRDFADDEFFVMLVTVPMYLYAYAMTALLIRRFLLRRLIPPGYTWGLCLALTALVWLFTGVLSLILNQAGFDTGFPWGNVLLFLNDPDESSHLAFAVAWALLVTAFWFPLALRQLALYFGIEAESNQSVPESGGTPSPATENVAPEDVDAGDAEDDAASDEPDAGDGVPPGLNAEDDVASDRTDTGQ